MKYIVKKLHYKVDNQKKAVVAIMDCLLRDYSYSIHKRFTVAGVAKCSPEDKWEESFGKKLATARAYYKMFNYGKTVLTKYSKITRKTLNALDDSLKKTNKCISSETRSINRLINLL